MFNFVRHKSQSFTGKRRRQQTKKLIEKLISLNYSFFELAIIRDANTDRLTFGNERKTRPCNLLIYRSGTIDFTGNFGPGAMMNLSQMGW